MKYKSITSENIEHDEANILTELLFLNHDLNIQPYPWRDKIYAKKWGKTVSLIKKLIRDFQLSPEQIAFYIYKCKPISLSEKEFGKAATVAKKLLRFLNLSQLVETYRNRRNLIRSEPVSDLLNFHKPAKKKSLLQLIKDIEDGKETI